MVDPAGENVGYVRRIYNMYFSRFLSIRLKSQDSNPFFAQAVKLVEVVLRTSMPPYNWLTDSPHSILTSAS